MNVLSTLAARKFVAKTGKSQTNEILHRLFTQLSDEVVYAGSWYCHEINSVFVPIGLNSLPIDGATCIYFVKEIIDQEEGAILGGVRKSQSVVPVPSRCASRST